MIRCGEGCECWGGVDVFGASSRCGRGEMGVVNGVNGD